jgi:hypothetical protein
MMPQKRSGISVMALMPIHAFGITLADMKFLKAKTILILWKGIMQNYVIISLVWLASRAAFRVVWKLYKTR